MKEGKKKFEPSKLYEALEKDAKGRANIGSPIRESDWVENQEWVRMTEKVIEMVPSLITQRVEEVGNWLEAFSSALYTIESKIFDPRFEGGTGTERCGRIRDNTASLRREVDELLKEAAASKWRKSIGIEKQEELLGKIGRIMAT